MCTPRIRTAGAKAVGPSITKTKAFLRDESGQDLIEYALIAGLLALAAVASLKNVANAVKSVFTSLDTAIMTNV